MDHRLDGQMGFLDVFPARYSFNLLHKLNAKEAGTQGANLFWLGIECITIIA